MLPNRTVNISLRSQGASAFRTGYIKPQLSGGLGEVLQEESYTFCTDASGDTSIDLPTKEGGIVYTAFIPAQNGKYSDFDFVLVPGGAISLDALLLAGIINPPQPLYDYVDEKFAEFQAGVNGKSAYEIAVENGFIGTEAQWLESLQGADGQDGTNGVNGTSGTNGTNGINGADGDDGKSAYQIALDNGFVGAESAWLASLKGADGADGQDGQDAVGGLTNQTGIALLSSTVVQTDVGTKQNLYTVPSGKKAVITRVISRDWSGYFEYDPALTIQIGVTGNDSGFYFTVEIIDSGFANDGGQSAFEMSASQSLGAFVSDLSNSATLTIDVFGYLIDA